jgi:hypothetical protein
MTTTETRREAYEAVKPKRLTKQEIVWRMLRHEGDATDRELAARLGWPINTITPRRGELVAAGRVVAVRETKDQGTGVRVVVWRAVTEPVKQDQQLHLGL